MIQGFVCFGNTCSKLILYIVHSRPLPGILFTKRSVAAGNKSCTKGLSISSTQKSFPEAPQTEICNFLILVSCLVLVAYGCFDINLFGLKINHVPKDCQYQAVLKDWLALCGSFMLVAYTVDQNLLTQGCEIDSQNLA